MSIILILVIYLGCVLVWITESRYGQLSVFSITQSAKRVESAEDILRKVLGALVRRPSALAALGQLRSHLETGAVLQPALACFLQLRYRRFTKGITSSAASTRAIVSPARTVVSAFLLLTGLLVLASHFIVLRSLWSPTTFPRFLVISCITDCMSRFIRKSVITLIFVCNFIIGYIQC